MPGLVPGILAFDSNSKKDVAGRDKPGHDRCRCVASAKSPDAKASGGVPTILESPSYTAVILRSALLRASPRMAAGACGPSFEARRKMRRAPQDDEGV
jgi:hypothetical protein